MSNYFTEGKHNIVYVGQSFKEWFGDIVVSVPKKNPKLNSFVLKKVMDDFEIQKEFNVKEVTLGDVAWAVENDKSMLKNGYANIFYVKDIHGVLRAVNVFWYDDGWSASAGVLDRFRWLDGYRVFSRNSRDPLTPMTLGTLESRIVELEKFRERIERVIKSLAEEDTKKKKLN